MKNTLLIFMALSLLSCKKEENIPCNCGEVLGSDIITQPGFQYTITVSNACSAPLS